MNEFTKIRSIILKARQQGFSTLVGLLFLLDTLTTPSTQSTIIAHDRETAEAIFKRIKKAYEWLPEDIRRHFPPQYDTRNELSWPTIDSAFTVATSGSKNIGRGKTIYNLHCSEPAFWENYQDIVAGLLETTPIEGNIILETTANGFNDFHAEWIAAEEQLSQFSPFFSAWWQHPEYQLPVDDPSTFILTDEEEKERKIYNLSLEQIQWKRFKKRFNKKFDQEYPASPRVAFLASGETFFDKDSLLALELGLRQPIQHDISIRYENLRKARKHLKVFEPPNPKHRYILFADCSEGLNLDGVHDFSSADVIDIDTWEQVAHLHGYFEPHMFGLILGDLGSYYNFALLGVERNNHGHSVLNTLSNAYGYEDETANAWGGLYLHADWDAPKVIPYNQRLRGWPTNKKTKVFMIDCLKECVDEQTLKIYNSETLSEMHSFVKLPGMKFGASGNSHDDRVISLSGAAALLIITAKKQRPKQEKKRRNTKRGGYV